jgi:hypothetical protein
MAYGALTDVAALSATYTTAGVYSTTTNPKAAQVELWLTDVSDLLDLALAQHRFTIPIDTGLANYVKITNILSNVVVPLVADLCHASNSSGRFFTQKAVEWGLSPMKVITKDINTWVEANADGLVALGLTLTPAESESNQMFVRIL